MRSFFFAASAMMAQNNVLVWAASSCLPPLTGAGANYTANITSLGCYVDANNRTLDGPQLNFPQTNSASVCANTITGETS